MVMPPRLRLNADNKDFPTANAQKDAITIATGVPGYSLPTGPALIASYPRCNYEDSRPCQQPRTAQFATIAQNATMTNCSACDDLDAVGIFFHFADVLAEAAITALAALVVGDRFEHMDSAKIGPQHIGDVHLGVGDLPEKEVGDAHFARGADEQIGVRHVRGVKLAMDVLFRDVLGRNVPAVDFRGEGAKRINQLGARTVI